MPRDTPCTRVPRAVQGHVVHRDALGELSKAIPRGGTCSWLRLKASREGGDQPRMGKPLLFGFLPSQVIQTRKQMEISKVWM